MSSTQLPSGAGKTSTRLIGHHFAVCRSSLATLTQLVIGLVIMALIVIGLTNPSGAQASCPRTESATSLTQQHDGFPTLFARCLHDMPASAHRTWSQSSQAAAIFYVRWTGYKRY